MTTDLFRGAGEYAAMLKATPMRNATLVASVAAVAADPCPHWSPQHRALRSAARLAAADGMQLQSLSAALLGRRPSEAYFVDRQWTSTTDQRGRVVQQHAFAAAVFKGASCSWLPLKAFRRPGASTLVDVERAGEPVEVNCTDL